jgi:hypothetical protein
MPRVHRSLQSAYDAESLDDGDADMNGGARI